MNLTLINGGPDQRVWDHVPVVARREDVERVAALTREARALLREAEAVNIGGRMTLGEDLALGQLDSDVEYHDRCLEQPGEFVITAWASGRDYSDDPAETQEYLDEQRRRNAAIGAGDFTPTGDLDYVLGAED